MVDDIVTDNESFDFEQAYQASFKDFEENTLIKAEVVDISSDTVFLNFGYKSEAKIPNSEFDVLPKIGDEVEIFLIYLEGRNGQPVVSKRKADYIIHKKDLKRIYSEREAITGVVKEVKSAGCIVDYKGISGFIPISLFDTNRQDDLTPFLKKEITFYIERLESKSQGRGNKEDFVGNRKKYLLEENNTLKKEFFEEKKEGDIVDGVVKTITDFGAFVDVGGVDALLHIKDISWKRNIKVADVLKQNEEIKVVILNIDTEKGKVGVGLKQLQADPWDDFYKKYKVEDVVVGTVLSIATYGVFVKIIDGVEGLLHISDMSWIKKIKNPSELVKVGQNLELKIIKIDEQSKKISLSLKHLLDNPWDNAEKKYKPGTKVKGKVVSVTGFGAFIELEQGIEALLHVEDISWTENVRNSYDFFKKDDEIEAVVVSCDAKKAKIKVGLKQLTEDPWKAIQDNYKTGDVITCSVDSIEAEKGLNVKLTDQVSCFIPIFHIGMGSKDDLKIELKNYTAGDEVKAMITNFDPKTRRINLSIKEYFKKIEREKVKTFLHDADEDSKYTLGDALKQKEDE